LLPKTTGLTSSLNPWLNPNFAFCMMK
jgi:hypothetical protein